MSSRKGQPRPAAGGGDRGLSFGAEEPEDVGGERDALWQRREGCVRGASDHAPDLAGDIVAGFVGKCLGHGLDAGTDATHQRQTGHVRNVSPPVLWGFDAGPSGCQRGLRQFEGQGVDGRGQGFDGDVALQLGVGMERAKDEDRRGAVERTTGRWYTALMRSSPAAACKRTPWAPARLAR